MILISLGEKRRICFSFLLDRDRHFSTFKSQQLNLRVWWVEILTLLLIWISYEKVKWFTVKYKTMVIFKIILTGCSKNKKNKKYLKVEEVKIIFN